MDMVPHKLDAQCVQVLVNLAEMVAREIERGALLVAQEEDDQLLIKAHGSFDRLLRGDDVLECVLRCADAAPACAPAGALGILFV
jgi:hypothetical protein